MRALKYFSAQAKRFLSVVPYVLLLSAILLLCLLIGFSQTADSEAEKQRKYELAIVGKPSDVYLNLGIAALQNLDNTRFAINLQLMESQEAEAALERGELDAYIIIPDEFVDNALSGDVGKLSFVTLPTAVGAIDYVKEELLSAVSTIMVESQKGAYGTAQAGKELARLPYYDTATNTTFSYVDLILSRGKLYEADTLGVAGGLSLLPSVLCGVLLFLILLLSIGFAPVFARNDTSFHRLLAASRFGAIPQVLCEYSAFFISLGIAAALLFGALFGFGGEMLTSVTAAEFDSDFFTALVLITAVFAAMQFLIYELTDGVAAGALAQFITSVALCYFCGCFYPIYFFPDAIQLIAPCLPAGAAHSLLAGAISGRDIFPQLLILSGYGVLFLCLSILLRYRKQTERGGEAA